jgi:hypothetical protein
MLRGETAEKKTNVILLVQVIAKESWKETFSNCFLNISEAFTNSLDYSLYKLPFLLLAAATSADLNRQTVGRYRPRRLAPLDPITFYVRKMHQSEEAHYSGSHFIWAAETETVAFQYISERKTGA